MKYPGYFLIVADFIQWAKQQGIPVVRPRLGSGLARRLCAHHHRSRSDPLRPDLRALPQSGSGVDAGFRHRFLPGPARRGHKVRAGSLRRDRVARSSPSAPCRRGACCATSAACCRCPMARSTSSASSCRKIPRPVTLARAIEEEPGCRPNATATRPSGAPSTSRASSKDSTGTPHARGRHRDRRPRAQRAGAALPRSEIRHAGHQFNMKWWSRRAW